MGTDIFGTEIKPGTIIAFVSSGAKIDIAVVDRTMTTRTGLLIGYKVVYPHTPLGAKGEVVIKKKTIRAGRELIAVPASWLSGLESGQACFTDHFASRIQYLADQYKPKREAQFGPDVFFSKEYHDGADKW